MSFDIGIVEDEPLVREAVASALEGGDDRHVAFAVGSAEEALEAIVRSPVDLLIVDMRLPGMDGVELIRRLGDVEPRPAVVVLSVVADEPTIFRALRAGAIGYLLKGLRSDQIVAAVEDLRRGGAPMSAWIVRRLVESLSGRAGSQGGEKLLSAREQEVLSLLGQGYTYQNVAARLGLSGHTVHSHVRNIYRKLHVSSRSEAVYQAVRRGLVQLG